MASIFDKIRGQDHYLGDRRIARWELCSWYRTLPLSYCPDSLRLMRGTLQGKQSLGLRHWGRETSANTTYVCYSQVITFIEHH
jgi:hypothetical protein